MSLQHSLLSYLCKFVVFKFETVACINAEGQQGDGDFGDNAGIVVFNEGIVTTDIDYGTKHGNTS